MFDYLFSLFKTQTLSAFGLNKHNLLSRSKREFCYVPGSKTLTVCIPGWGQPISKWGIVKRYVLKRKSSFLVYQFPRGILSDDPILTREIIHSIKDIVKKDIENLKKVHNFEECTLVSISLGSTYGSMIYKDNKDINNILLIVPGNDIAEDTWLSYRTDHIKKAYERKGVTLEKLKKEWEDLSPENNMPAKNRNIVILYGKYDKIINYAESKKLVRVMRENGLRPHVKVYPLEHYFVSLYFLLFPVHFLRKLYKNKSNIEAQKQ